MADCRLELAAMQMASRVQRMDGGRSDARGSESHTACRSESLQGVEAVEEADKRAISDG